MQEYRHDPLWKIIMDALEAAHMPRRAPNAPLEEGEPECEDGEGSAKNYNRR